MKGRTILTIFCVLAVFFIFFGCSIDYEGDSIADSLGEEVPDTVLYRFVQTKVTNGIPEIRVYGSQAESYGKKKQTVLMDVLFQEFDKAGNLVTEGTADNIVYFTETEDAEIRGNIDFYSESEDAGIRGDYLYWNNRDNILSSRPENIMRMDRKDGTYIEGRGFTTNVKERSVTFAENVEGLWVDEED